MSEETTSHVGLYKYGQGKPNWQYTADMETLDEEIERIDSEIDKLPTRSWVNSNFNNYTDDDARSALNWSTLTGSLEIAAGNDGEGIHIAGSGDGRTYITPQNPDGTWNWSRELTYSSDYGEWVFEGSPENSQDTLADQTWVSNNFNNYTDSEAVAAIETTTLSGPITIDPGTHGDPGLELNGGDISSVDDLYFDSTSGAQVFIDDTAAVGLYSGGDVDILNGTLSEQGNRVATRTWVDSNSSSYTDSDARNAVTSGTLSGDLTFDSSAARSIYHGTSEVFVFDGTGIDVVAGELYEGGQRAVVSQDTSSITVEVDESNGIVNFIT